MIYKRNKTYHVDVTVNGLRYRESLETTNWQVAQRKQKELIGRILEGKAGAPAGRVSIASMPFEQFRSEPATADSRFDGGSAYWTDIRKPKEEKAAKVTLNDTR